MKARWIRRPRIVAAVATFYYLAVICDPLNWWITDIKTALAS